MVNEASPLVFAVDEAEFPERVLRRSAEVPVVVDFWAAWCGPCRTLGPMLEQAVADRGGAVELAKVDVDRNQGLAQSFGVQGIPAVLGFRDGKVVSQFTGAVPPPQLQAFLDELVPTAADEAVARARALSGEQAEAQLRAALEQEPTHREAAIGLAELIVERDPEAALDLVRDHRPDPAAEAVVTRAQLAADGDVDIDALRTRLDTGDGDGATSLELGRALAARGEYEEALDRLLVAVELGGDSREPAREQVVALFNVLGATDERVRRARPRLARALY
jgi:putative thioredoxin